MPLDITLALDAALWAILEAPSAAFVAEVPKPECRLKADTTSKVSKARAKVAPNDYPQVALTWTPTYGAMVDTASAPRTFAMNRTNYSSAVCDVVIPSSVIGKFIIIYDKVMLSEQTPVESAIVSDLMKKWPHLGVTAFRVTNFNFRIDRTVERITNAQDNGPRTKSILTMTINTRPKLSQL